jgi:hypothetical protein
MLMSVFPAQHELRFETLAERATSAFVVTSHSDTPLMIKFSRISVPGEVVLIPGTEPVLIPPRESSGFAFDGRLVPAFAGETLATERRQCDLTVRLGVLGFAPGGALEAPVRSEIDLKIQVWLPTGCPVAPTLRLGVISF